jgi:protein-L-isoaspartate O-methyltransferase
METREILLKASRHVHLLSLQGTSGRLTFVEIIPSLAEAAAKVLRELGYNNVSVKVGDGYLGWPECGPFDPMILRF